MKFETFEEWATNYLCTVVLPHFGNAEFLSKENHKNRLLKELGMKHEVEKMSQRYGFDKKDNKIENVTIYTTMVI